ncbi:phosphatase [Acrocarpospora corrugata]|uniref:Phosphatase n=1 Tax=Acrocarpospora corrugata TaxID=35763 RepID=A0A5M3W152_9ACTN|nr:HAD family phosphatase [Acrocarpospora corrugata]GES02837.1 phosphatase [Acrocarpospora corrugata]
MGLTAALFDLDGTLINSEARSLAMWALLLDNHGVEHDENVLRGFMGRRVLDVLGGLLPGADAQALLAEIGDYALRPGLPEIEIVPGAVDFVRSVAAAGAPAALVTSARRWWAEDRLGWLGVRDAVQTIVSGEDVTAGKPDPEAYLTAAARLGVEPADCVVFEDSLAGIAAARAAGMTCVGLATTHHPGELAHADLVVADLTGVEWPITGWSGPPA